MSGLDRNDGRFAGVEDDPRLSAYALGELEGAEYDEVARLVATDPRARALVDELRGVAADLEAALASEASAPDASLTPAQRAAVAARAGALVTPRTRPRRRLVLVLGSALAATCAAVVGVSALRGRLGGTDDALVADAPARSWAKKLGSGEMRLRRVLPASQAAGTSAEPVVARRSLEGEIAQDPAAVDQLDALELEEVDAEIDFAEAPQEEEPPAEPWNREGYDRVVENPFVPTRVDRFSTFSIDVDTASYTNVRRMLASGGTVPPDAVRVEEFVNYFRYAYAPPPAGSEHPFAVHVDVGAAPWAPQHRLVRVGLKARDIDLARRKPSNLVFLLDVSGSMDDPAKLPLVKRALALLVDELGEGDSVSIVVYASAEGLALPPTSGEAREAILQALERLDAGGSTNGGAGIQLAYQVARERFIEGGINRVLLCTDGDFNVGVSSDGELERLIEREAQSGVFLTVLGFGSGNWQDAKMEKLSNRGNGNFAYIDSLLEARKVLVEELGGTLETVAKDVKVQVEFNPAEVQAARLIGYENRVLAHQDFLDDTKDAGEIGAGHTVTALYEVIPVGVPYEPPAMPESRYATEPLPAAGAASGELLTVKLRYKAPDGDASTGFEVPVMDGGANFDQAAEDTRFAAAVAAFGMLLRGSEHVGTATLDDVRRWALEATGEDPGGYRAGFMELVERARRLERR